MTAEVFTGETTATYVAMLKEWYTPKRVQNLVFKNAPLLAMIPKEPNLSGESWDVPLIYGDPQAGSALFATAQANKGNLSTAKFQVPTENEYSLAAISRKVKLASRDNKGAFLPGVKPNINGALNTCKRSLAIQGYRDGTGFKGTINAIDDTGANGIITLGNPDASGTASRHEAVNFHKGEVIQCWDVSIGTPALSTSGASMTIVSVDRGAGTITVSGKTSGTWTTDGGAAAGDRLLRAGDANAVIDGLSSWIQTTSPSDTFHGVDRSLDPVLLGGVRYTGTGQLVHEALIDGQSEVGTIGDGEPDHAFCHPSQFRALLKEMGGKVELSDYAVTQDISFRGFTIHGDYGDLRVVPDRYAYPTRAHLLTLEDWECGSMGPLPDIFDRDNDQEMLRDSTTDGYEVRTGGYGNFACRAPGHSGVVVLDLRS